MSENITNDTGSVEKENVNNDIEGKVPFNYIDGEFPIKFYNRDKDACVRFYLSIYVMQYRNKDTKEWVPLIDLEGGKNTHEWRLGINGVGGDYWSAEKGMFIDDARQLVREHPEASLKELTERIKSEARSIQVDPPAEYQLRARRWHRHKTGDDRDPALLLMIANFERAIEMVAEYVADRDDWKRRSTWLQRTTVEWTHYLDGTYAITGLYTKELDEEQEAAPQQEAASQQEAAPEQERLAIEFASEEERVQEQEGTEEEES